MSYVENQLKWCIVTAAAMSICLFFFLFLEMKSASNDCNECYSYLLEKISYQSEKIKELEEQLEYQTQLNALKHNITRDMIFRMVAKKGSDVYEAAEEDANICLQKIFELEKPNSISEFLISE